MAGLFSFQWDTLWQSATWCHIPTGSCGDFLGTGMVVTFMRWDITPVILVISVICPLIGGTPHTKMVRRLMLVFEGALFSSSTQSWASTRCSWVCNAIKNVYLAGVYVSSVFFPHPILRFHLYLLISSTWIYILLEFYHYQLPINIYIYNPILPISNYLSKCFYNPSPNTGRIRHGRSDLITDFASICTMFACQSKIIYSPGKF